MTDDAALGAVVKDMFDLSLRQAGVENLDVSVKACTAVCAHEDVRLCRDHRNASCAQERVPYCPFEGPQHDSGVARYEANAEADAIVESLFQKRDWVVRLCACFKCKAVLNTMPAQAYHDDLVAAPPDAELYEDDDDDEEDEVDDNFVELDEDEDDEDEGDDEDEDDEDEGDDEDEDEDDKDDDGLNLVLPHCSSRRATGPQCNICFKHLYGAAELAVHLDRVHNENRVDRWQCDTCHRRFGSKSHLTTHVRTVHLQERRFPCDKCELTFKHYHQLYEHELQVHHKIRSEACRLCGRHFSKRTNLLRHLREVHRDYDGQEDGGQE